MAPLVLEGETLGQKHRNYNKLVSEKIKDKVSEINYEESDLDNLLKIDIACKNRNVDYILKVFESEDMLYVSRAIKQSTWLITDPQYAHIINPTYLYDNLCPKMTVKSFNKLMLNVRLNLKDEVRAEEFFNHYKERDFKVAIKWLPLCSVKLTEEIMNKNGIDIPKHMFKKLCEKSVSCLEEYFSGRKSYRKCDAIESTAYFLKTDIERYLTLVEMTPAHTIPRFGPKKTRLIMTKCPKRVMDNLSVYCNFLHIPTFVKYIKREDMKEFILSNINKRELRNWFSQNNIDPFIKRLPEEIRFSFVKEMFIDRKQNNIDEETIMHCYGQFLGNPSSSQNIYRWYKYASFDTAFVDLKKLIRSESNPTERIAIFAVLITCAGKDMKHINTLIKYYRENHINESFKFKIQFVNLVISHTTTHKFDKETWGYLNDLFRSMEVYTESENMVQFCVRSIILYNVLHNENIPDIIQKKFVFDTFKNYQNKLTEEEKEKVFQYLYNYLTSKIENLDVNKEHDFYEIGVQLRNAYNLLIDWNKELEDYPNTLDKVKEVYKVKEKNKWHNSLNAFYKTKKSWQKLLLHESIFLNPSQKTCINALKHRPELLLQYRNSVEAMLLNDQIQKLQFLKKLRIYWQQSLANTYKDFFLSKFDQINAHKTIIKGLCTLLPRDQLSRLVEKYAPSENKIDWAQQDDLELSIRKHLAMNLSLSRPQPSVTTALLYAKGDYLQYVLPSLKSILHNTSSTKIREHLPKLLKAPVSLQKHGIRVAFAKLKHDELKQIFSDIWKTAKNSSIRADIFNQTLNFLREEKDEAVIREMWHLLSIFIDNLTSEENKLIYTKLSQVEKVPLLVRPEYWVKSYRFLKSLPAQANGDVFVANLMSNMLDIMHLLDSAFVGEILLESFEEKISTGRYQYTNLLPMFLLSTKTEEKHNERIKIVLIPMLEKSLAIWDKTHSGSRYIQSNMLEVFSNLDQQFERIVLCQKMFMPVPLYNEIFVRVRDKLSILEHYVTITSRKLALECVKIFERVLYNNESLRTERQSHETADCAAWGPLYDESAIELGKVATQILKEDAKNYFPSIYLLFAEVFNKFFTSYGFNTLNKMRALRSFIETENENHFYLFVLSQMPSHGYDEREIQFKTKLLDDINANPSQEVQMHYWLWKNKQPNNFVNAFNPMLGFR